MKGMDRRKFIGRSVRGAAAISLGTITIDSVLAEQTQTKQPAEIEFRQIEVPYKQAIVKKYPEQLIVTIAKDKNGKANPVTMGWTMITSGSPAMLACSMHQGHYTVTCVRHSKGFTIAFPSAEMADAVLFFGTHTGWDTDKFAEFKCPHTPATKIDSVLLTDAVANFECELEKECVTGDHIIFVGRVVASHINRSPKRRLYIIGPGRQLGAVEAIKS